MDKRTVFTKSQKGKDEIETRQYRLPARLRMALILVDGKSNVELLVEKGGHPDLINTLEELTQLGFIQAVTAGVSPSPVPAVTKPQAGAPLKAELIRITRDILGAQADKIIKMIEDSPDTKEALGATLKKCIELVRLIVDEKKSKALSIKYTETLNRI